MPRLTGIDEAGYGPNLGPFVMSSVTFRVPDAASDLRKLLAKCVRDASEPADIRVLIDDSKRVYAGPRPLPRLESSALALLWPMIVDTPTVGGLIKALAPASAADLQAESWYDADTTLPLVIHDAVATEFASQLVSGCRAARVELGPVRSRIVTAGRFNAILDAESNKSAVPRRTLSQLLGAVSRGPGEFAAVRVDKQGGRSYYTAMLQDAWPGLWIEPVQEAAESSRYRALANGEPVAEVVFRVRADSEYLDVAAASLVSKYLREVLMLQFNRFWVQRVPGLAPTAGYPVDAARFFAAIRDELPKAGLSESAVWRRK